MRYKDQEFSRREQCILETALTLFAEKSLEKVTVSELAERAGIGKGTVYKHFTSKEEILARLVLRFEQDCLEVYRAMAEQDQPLTALRRIFRKAFDLILASPVQAQMNMVCSSAQFQERLRPQYREQFTELEGSYFKLFCQILENAIAQKALPAQPVEPLFLGLIAAFEGAMFRLGNGGAPLATIEVNRTTYLDKVTDFMLAGILGMQAVEALKVSDSKTDVAEVGTII